MEGIYTPSFEEIAERVYGEYERKLGRLKLDGGNIVLSKYAIDVLARYVAAGVAPESYWRGVLANDFRRVAIRTAEDALERLPLYAVALDYLPALCRGSYEIVQAWIDFRGAAGLYLEHHGMQNQESF